MEPSFAPFSRLPRELQDLIWEAAIPSRQQARVFSVTPRCHAHITWLARLLDNEDSHQTSLHLGYGVKIPPSEYVAAVHTLLRTCRRSHAVAQLALQRHPRTQQPVTVYAFDGYPDHIVPATGMDKDTGCRFPTATADGALDLFLLQPRGNDLLCRQTCGLDMQGVAGVRFVAVSMLRLLDPQSRVAVACPYWQRAFPDLRVLYVYVSPALLSHCMGRDGWSVEAPERRDRNPAAADLSRFIAQYGSADHGGEPKGSRFVAATGSGTTWVTVTPDELRRVTRGPLCNIISCVGGGVAAFPNLLPRQVKIVTDLGYQGVEPVRRQPVRLHPPRFLMERSTSSSGKLPAAAAAEMPTRARHPFWETGAQEFSLLQDDDSSKAGEEDDGDTETESEHRVTLGTKKQISRWAKRIGGQVREVKRTLGSCFRPSSK